eukprot:4667469-Lingulodinium_polyedra.AAC.1
MAVVELKPARTNAEPEMHPASCLGKLLRACRCLQGGSARECASVTESTGDSCGCGSLSYRHRCSRVTFG